MDYIQISKINDFIFCPRSIYMHSIYEKFSPKLYHRTPQAVGKIKHENIDEGRYSTSKKYLQGIEIYSEKYNIVGKIDIYDKEKCALIERKNKISNIYDGYKYQLYAQMFCLEEMGYEVKKIILHSLSDNKRRNLPLPDKKEIKKFEGVIDKIKKFDINNFNYLYNKNKCDNCIYKELCH